MGSWDHGMGFSAACSNSARLMNYHSNAIMVMIVKIIMGAGSGLDLAPFLNVISDNNLVFLKGISTMHIANNASGS